MSSELEARVKSLEDTLQRITQALITVPSNAGQGAPRPKETPPTASPNAPTPPNHTIKELQDGMKRITVTGQITEKAAPYHAGEHEAAHATLADESGSIKLTLWDRQIQAVQEGDTVKIENGYVTNYKGTIQLNIGKYGKLIVNDTEVT